MSKEQKDLLGQRMKEQYEDRTRYFLPRRSYTVIRLDGRAFHTYTQGLDPFNEKLLYALTVAGGALLAESQGGQFGFVQSDEVSILLTDFADEKTAAWFDGNLQKIASVSASILTGAFNRLAGQYKLQPGRIATFDARAFVIPDPVEVENYFVWRQKDAIRNSLNALAQKVLGHAAVQGKNKFELHEALYKAGVNWATALPVPFKNGMALIKTGGAVFPFGPDMNTPVFTESREYLRNRVPIQWAEDNLKGSGPNYDKSTSVNRTVTQVAVEEANKADAGRPRYRDLPPFVAPRPRQIPWCEIIGWPPRERKVYM